MVVIDLPQGKGQATNLRFRPVNPQAREAFEYPGKRQLNRSEASVSTEAE